ncbi:MAG TPA: hypothetical protein VFZ66_06230 [Herpetosiphonaceae bacterium]
MALIRARAINQPTGRTDRCLVCRLVCDWEANGAANHASAARYRGYHHVQPRWITYGRFCGIVPLTRGTKLADTCKQLRGRSIVRWVATMRRKTRLAALSVGAVAAHPPPLNERAVV